MNRFVNEIKLDNLKFYFVYLYQSIMLKLLLLFSAYMIMSAPLAFAQRKTAKTIPSTYFIERNEIQLSEAINKFRVKKGLGELQLSPSLSYVAKTHLNDIRLHSKDQHGCNLNSWSDKGKWTSCCFNSKQKDLELMTTKPEEITGFRGKGYEIVIMAKKGVSTKNLTDLWLAATMTEEFLLNAGQGSNRNWQSMGVSIYHGFASIWLSEMPDRITDIPLAKDAASRIAKAALPVHSVVKVAIATAIPAAATTLPEKHDQTKSAYKPDLNVYNVKPSNQTKGTSYFLVQSSYTSLPDAMKQIETLKKEGFQNLVMIDARGKYRVALGIYTTEADAIIAMRKNYPRFDKLKIYLF